jgi:hypothetical protein
MRTYSDTPPKVTRLQGKILFPRDIREETVTDDEGETRTQYSCDLLSLDDAGQSVSGPDFTTANYAALRQAAILKHWPQSSQNEAVMEDAAGRPEKLEEYLAFKEALDLEFPKP